MDEATLRAMMPMSFGKKGGSSKPSIKTNTDIHSPSNAASSAHMKESPAATNFNLSEGRRLNGKGQTKVGLEANGDDDGVSDDIDENGLTAAEREANEKLLEANDSDGSDSDDLGPEPPGPDINSYLPIEETVELKDHKKAVSALSVDPAGARVATGSFDYDIKLWDFGGMTQSFQPFQTFEPEESHIIKDLAWSHNGEKLLVAPGTAQPKMFDRNGEELATYKKGDVYIRDMKNTAGHVSELTSSFWSPTDRNTFATSSTDSTIRLWDAEQTTRQKTVVVVKSKERGTRTRVTCSGFSADGKMLGAGCLDGALHLWSTTGTYSRPNATIEGAHERNSDISSISFTKDGRTLASRGCDGTVKLWDVRNFRKPLAERKGLLNSFAQTNVIFSPDDNFVLTGTSSERAHDDENGDLGSITKPGSIQVLSRSDLSTLQTVDMKDDRSSVIKVEWHPRINQLLASTAQGIVHLYYSPTASTRGALLCVSKKSRVRRRSIEEEFGHIDGPIIAPDEDDFDERGLGTGFMAKKRRMEKVRQDPVASRLPERPLEGRGQGGRIGSAATQYMVQSIFNDNSRSEDPRE